MQCSGVSGTGSRRVQFMAFGPGNCKTCSSRAVCFSVLQRERPSTPETDQHLRAGYREGAFTPCVPGRRRGDGRIFNALARRYGRGDGAARKRVCKRRRIPDRRRKIPPHRRRDWGSTYVGACETGFWRCDSCTWLP